MKNVKIERIQAFGLGIFEFDFLITDLESGFIFWVNPGLNFFIYKNFSNYFENDYDLACDGEKLEELIINLEELEKIEEFIILKDTNIHLHGRKKANGIIGIKSDFYSNKLNVSMKINNEYLKRFIDILSRFQHLPFHEKISF